MSHNHGGFFSLNRLFGKKIKHEKTTSTSMSKSTAQTLTRSATSPLANPDEISPQNKIVPLTTIPNAPFEQTFRITIYLPHGQLYVARIGAKTKLSELLNTICINKSLDANKFEFKHPTDVSQVFDVSFTVGEVGLSEIKLVPKTSKEDSSVRYRIHSNFSRENRLVARPHTMSSVSPYSSTNSLNSTDSSGIMMNQRVNNNGAPVAPNRKKRIAPRPPSQNSIPENPEKICSTDEPNSRNSRNVANSKNDPKYYNLMRQNFHMSSPNLAINNSITFKSDAIDTNPTINDNFDRRQSEYCLINSKKLSLHRPMSIQLDKTISDDHSHEFRHQISENLNSTKIQHHSRTPSDTSVINDITFPEPQPRSRPPINKKKAPAPPPRTVSHGQPIAQPRHAVSKLSIDDTKSELMDEATHKSLPGSPDSDNTRPSVIKTTNVSKVLLNANETALVIAKSSIDADVSNSGNKCPEKILAIRSNDIEKETSNQGTADSTTKSKSISVINLNSENNEQTNKLSESDHIAISLQVNEIIDEAVKINQATMNTETDEEYKEDHSQIERLGEINNNNMNDTDKGHEEGDTNEEQHWSYDRNEHRAEIPSPIIHSDSFNTAKIEIPIQPVLNETRTFSFQEYSDNSLPTSTTSTLNTGETPSTGPESLITSDIEDGYKGNELEKKRKLEIGKRDSKEDFIESQFEFLKEHLDNKTNADSDEEKSMDFSKRDIISSTMINENSKNARQTQSIGKNDVINELTQIISCNRLDTFIKPSTETNHVVPCKTSSLKNFQISAYTNGNSEMTKSTQINNISECSSLQSLSTQQSSKQDESQCIEDSSTGLSYSLENETNPVNLNETFVIAKQVNRSVSFHTTASPTMDGTTWAMNADSATSNSFLSLNGPLKYEQSTTKSQESCSIGSTPQKSSSELSIADTPSLQSIRVMKSILNSSIKLNPTATNIQEEEKTAVAEEKKADACSETCSDAPKPDTVNQRKAWIYQGPPSINFSTWGDRPKSTVNIKSDEDYIFGGTSKMAALQKRFSGVETVNRKDEHSRVELTYPKSKEKCDSSICNLPVVRSVEYKKNVSQNENNTAIADTPDSTQQNTSFRYEVAHIVSDNSFSTKGRKHATDFTENDTAKSVVAKPINSPQTINSKTGSMLRVQSFNIPNKIPSVNQLKIAKEAEKRELEKPIFTQFMLRKTGLKEKMFDGPCEDNIKHSNTFQVKADSNPIPTAPKPPPTLAKPKIRPVSMNIQIDTRGELLDSIRNFNRGTLKRNVIY